MSTVLFKRGDMATMNSTPVTDGLVYFNEENNRIYMDNGNTRYQYGGDTELISAPNAATASNAFNATASLNLFSQKTTVVDTKANALAVTQNYIPLGCLAFKEALGTTDYSAVGNGTISGGLTTLNTRTNTLVNQLTANNKSIYMDYKDGQYGYNTSANRGADTFHPFKTDPVRYTLKTNASSGAHNLATDITALGIDYTKLTVNNFYYVPNALNMSFRQYAEGDATGSHSLSPTFSYEPQSGVYTITDAAGYWNYGGDPVNYHALSSSGYIYLVV